MKTDAFSDRAPSIRGVLASLSLCMLLPALGTSSANVALPTLADAFGASFRHVQWVVLAYLLATTTLVVGAGRLGDLFGRRRVLLAGVLLFTAASLVCSVAPTLELLIAARVAQGAGAAAMMALTMSFVADALPKSRAGAAMGLLGTMSAVGTALGPSLGGAAIAAFGWPAIFAVNVPLGLAAGLLVHRHLPAAGRAAARAQPFDVPGTLLLALTLAAYALAMTLGRAQPGLALGLLALAAAGLAGFVIVETRAAAPLIRLASLRDPVLGAGLATGALVSTVMMATLVVGPFYLARGLGLHAALVGLVMSAGPLVAALAGVPAGRLVDRVGAPRVGAGGLVAMAAGCGLLGLLPAGTGVAGYVLPIAVTTAGYALFQAANNTAVMAQVPAERRGVTSGLLNLARNLGLVTGASAMGAVFAFGSGAAEIATASPEAVAAGLRVTFALGAALVVLALGVALAPAALQRMRIARGVGG